MFTFESLVIKRSNKILQDMQSTCLLSPIGPHPEKNRRCTYIGIRLELQETTYLPKLHGSAFMAKLVIQYTIDNERRTRKRKTVVLTCVAATVK